jgi:hypothetical protein
MQATCTSFGGLSGLHKNDFIMVAKTDELTI